MPSYPAKHLAFSVVCVFGLFFTGCGDASNGPRYGEWTLAEDSIQLTETLRVSETEAFFFGAIAGLDVTSDGHMVAADREAGNLKVLRPDGTLLDTLGRPGQGPGEFRGPTSVDVARNDSVYVFDNRPDRLTVFASPPSVERVRSVVISGDGGNPVDVRVLGDRLVGKVTPGYTRKEGLHRPSPNTWHLLDGTNMGGDSLLRVRRRNVATSFGGSGAAIAYLPFGRVTQMAPGPDGRLYHGFTDSLRIRATSLEGRTETIATVPAPPVPVTKAERDSTLEPIPAKIRRPIESAFPETKPAFTALVVGDDGRLWVRRPPKGPDAPATSWWVLDPETKTIHEIQLPTEVDLEVVRDGNAYGTTKTEMGAPAVVRYRIE